MIKTFSICLAVFGAVALSANAQRGPSSVFVSSVETHPFSQRIEALGTLEPNERVDLTLNAADRITAIFFEDGQRVDEGKTLLSLAQREQVALVEAAEATVEEAKRQYERISRLAEMEAVSGSERDQAQRNLDNASAQLRAVQSRQKDRVLVAPFSGVLGFRNVSVGSYIRPGDIVTSLIDDSKMKLEFSVPSTFMRSIHVGLKIEALTDDYPGQVFTGELTSIDNAIDPVTRSISARATLPNPDLLLKAGMFMRVTLYADERNSLAIPQEATESIGPDTYAYVVTENEQGQKIATRKYIRIGARQDGYVEILEGLTSSDTIVREGLNKIRNGAPIKIEQSAVMTSTLTAASGTASDTTLEN